jgi:hypothetical protein
MEIVETPIFTRKLRDAMTSEDYRLLQVYLIARPDAGTLIQGGGGLRKIRWVADGQGKRGGVRVIYFWAVSPEQLLMLYVYSKSEAEDLTRDQVKALRRLVEAEYP